MAKNVKRLSHQQYFELANWLIQEAGLAREIGSWPAEIAAKAEKDLGFEICADSLRNTARANNIQLLEKRPDGTGGERGARSGAGRKLESQLDRIEAKIDAIMEAWDVSPAD